MFKDNKYTKWYNSIIERAKIRKFPNGEYRERHHHIPRCLGGTETVNLTAREHFICHMLLTKMSDDYRLKFAIVMLTLKNPKQAGRIRISSHSYAYIKKCNSVASSVRQSGVANNAGKVHCYDPATCKSYFKFPDQIPSGYILGRHPKFREKLKGQHKGNTYYYDPLTMKTISLKPGNVPPHGYIKGNPVMSSGDYTRHSKWWHDPVTLIEVRAKTQPTGFIPGRSVVWITDGVNNKQVKQTNQLPTNWRLGKSGHPGRNLAIKRITTPLGIFNHPLRFCEIYACSKSIFKNLDVKLKIRKRNDILNKALIDVGYDFSKTKSENGFKFID